MNGRVRRYVRERDARAAQDRVYANTPTPPPSRQVKRAGERAEAKWAARRATAQARLDKRNARKAKRGDNG